MSTTKTKQRRNLGLMLMLYQRPLHPELFNLLQTVDVDRRAYESSVWLVEGGHVVTFSATAAGSTWCPEAAGNTFTEVVQMNGEPVDDRGLLDSLPCRGERYHELEVGPNLKYMVSTQEEQLSPTLFDATREEILEYADKRELLVGQVAATSERGAYTGVLDIERRAHELHVDSFHLFEDNHTVVKTQSFVEVLKRPIKDSERREPILEL
jgi:hypothetical protein